MFDFAQIKLIQKLLSSEIAISWINPPIVASYQKLGIILANKVQKSRKIQIIFDRKK